MTVTHPITVDLVQPGIKPRLYAMQFDANTRIVAITLQSQGSPWEIPADAAFGLSYRKRDGTRGFYPEGITASGNTVAVTLAPQVLTCPGMVEAALICTDSAGQRISAFPFEVCVAADPAGGSTVSEEYFPAYPWGKQLKSWEIQESADAVTLHYTLEDGIPHTDVLVFNAAGYPATLTHDGVTATGTWREENG